MKRVSRLLRTFLSVMMAVTVFSTAFNSYALSDTSDSYAFSEKVGYAYKDQIYFDPLDIRPLNSIDFNKYYALADESYYWDLNGRDVNKCQTEYEKVVNAILAKINPAWSDFRKLAYLHDYICETTEYDWTGTDMIKQSAYGCLVLHNCVCDGFARAFYDLANRLGIETYYVLSNEMNHAWNLSKLNGRFYFIDCTWDGTYTTEHTYFLKSESYMRSYSHDYKDICIPAYATVGSYTDINIYNRYNDKSYDSAAFTNIKGPIFWSGDGDGYYVVTIDDSYPYENHLKVVNGNGVSSEIKLVSDLDDLGSITYLYGRGNIVILVLNSNTICYGKINNNKCELKVLEEIEESYDRYEYYSDFNINGNIFRAVQNTYDYNNGISETENIKIDLSDIFKGIQDPFDISARGQSSINYIADTSGSAYIIEGMNCKWNTVNGKSYWYENDIKQGTYNDANGVLGDGSIRGREIYDPKSDGWYWLDSCYFGAKATDKEVWIPYIYQNEDDLNNNELLQLAYECDGGWDGLGQVAYKAMTEKAGKWVRYDENGKMLKGWVEIKDDLAKLYPDQKGNVYYYDNKTGLMAKGYVTIDSVTYYFNEETGVLQK